MKKTVLLIFERISERKKRSTPSKNIVLSFAAVIVIGACLLMLPVSSANREVTPFLTALFTATSATCVTGLIIEETGLYFSLFGQFVILALIQIGGLGFITILATALLRASKKMNLRNRIVVAQSFGIDYMDDVTIVAGYVMKLTFAVEGIAAAVLSLRFIPRFGVFRGIWYGVFHSVSAFCNAGFDVFGQKNSLIGFNNDPIVMLVISLLIIIGGLGFLVWVEVLNKKSLKKMSTYSRLVIMITAILLILGTVLFFILERKNVLENMPLWQQLLNSFFQSVTCRTAGFDSLGQTLLTEQSKLVSVILMLIGGASGSTAGGVKVATIGVVVMAIMTSLRGKNSVVFSGRKISERSVNNAAMLLGLWALLVIGATLFISVTDRIGLIDTLYEVTSAYGTVGLSVGVTAVSSAITKLILIAYMFFGRVGVMTISVMFIARQSTKERVKYPEARIVIG